MADTKKRKTIAEQRAELEQKKKDLEAERKAKQKKLDQQLAQLAERERAKVRKFDAHLKIVMGAAGQAHARISSTWRKQFRLMLDEVPMKERDKMLVAEWFQRLDAELKAQEEKQEQDKARQK